MSRFVTHSLTHSLNLSITGTPKELASHYPPRHVVLPPSNTIPRVAISSDDDIKKKKAKTPIKQGVRDAKIIVQNRQSKEYRRRALSRVEKMVEPSTRADRVVASDKLSPTIFRAISPSKALRVTKKKNSSRRAVAEESKSNHVALDCFRLGAKLALRRRKDEQQRRRRRRRVQKEMRIVPTSTPARRRQRDGFVARENFERLSRPSRLLPSTPSQRRELIPPPPPPDLPVLPPLPLLSSSQQQQQQYYNKETKEANVRLDRIRRLLVQQHQLPQSPTTRGTTPPGLSRTFSSSPSSLSQQRQKQVNNKKSTPENMRWRAHVTHLQIHNENNKRRYVDQEDASAPSSTTFIQYSDTVSQRWPQYDQARGHLSYLESPKESKQFLNPLRADDESSLLHVDAIRKRMTDAAVEQAILRNTEHYELTRQEKPKRPYDDYVLHSETCRCMSCWAIRSARNRV